MVRVTTFPEVVHEADDRPLTAEQDGEEGGVIPVGNVISKISPVT
jgi:hypothetical protein